MSFNQLNISPTGGQPTAAPDFPPVGGVVVVLVAVPRYIVCFPELNAAALSDLPPINAGTPATTVAADFGGAFVPSDGSVTLVGEPTVECTVRTGEDPDPQSRITVDPQIGTAPKPFGSGLPDSAILFRVGNPLGGVTYLLYVECPMSNGDTASAWTHLPCQTPN